MDGPSLYQFYEKAVLPQFGLKDAQIEWQNSQNIVDEAVHYFQIGQQAYALIFEDYDGVGRSAAFIQEHVAIRSPKYSFVGPIAQATNPPSYDGFSLPAPFQYCFNVTGTFTLLKLESSS
jgi:hypothetical protein